MDDKDFNASVSGSIFRVESNQSGSCSLVARQNNYTSRVELKWGTDLIKMFFIAIDASHKLV